MADYLKEIPPIITFSTPMIKAKIDHIKSKSQNTLERAGMAFLIARDEIRHSFDLQSDIVTITAEEVLSNREGICFAKSHLLAALLRGIGIPAGFCYQRVTRKGTVESGYALHGLNAVYLNNFGWFRVDPRGNKPGVNAQFTPPVEQLAYSIHSELGEIDYPDILVSPYSPVVEMMRRSNNYDDLFFTRPERLEKQ